MGQSLPLELPSHSVLAQLACEDPAAYEALRLALIKDFLDSAPERMQPRLRGLQFRIDCVRQLSRSPLGSTIKIYKLMYESFMRLNQEISGLRDTEPRPAAHDLPAPCARIIELQEVRKLRHSVER